MQLFRLIGLYRSRGIWIHKERLDFSGKEPNQFSGKLWFNTYPSMLLLLRRSPSRQVCETGSLEKKVSGHIDHSHFFYVCTAWHEQATILQSARFLDLPFQPFLLLCPSRVLIFRLFCPKETPSASVMTRLGKLAWALLHTFTRRECSWTVPFFFFFQYEH